MRFLRLPLSGIQSYTIEDVKINNITINKETKWYIIRYHA